MSAGGQPGTTEGLEETTAGAVVTLDGDLDIVTSEDVKRQLAALVHGGSRSVTVDVGAVDFVDSSGLGALVAVHQLASANGSRFVVRSVPSRLQNLLRLTRLDDLLRVE